MAGVADTLTIDSGERSHLAVCGLPACGWRYLTTDRGDASAALVNHVRGVHPDDQGAQLRASRRAYLDRGRGR